MELAMRHGYRTRSYISSVQSTLPKSVSLSLPLQNLVFEVAAFREDIDLDLTNLTAIR